MPFMLYVPYSTQFVQKNASKDQEITILGKDQLA